MHHQCVTLGDSERCYNFPCQMWCTALQFAVRERRKAKPVDGSGCHAGRKVQGLFALFQKPPPPAPQPPTRPLHPRPNGWATNPPIREWRILSSQCEHVRIPRLCANPPTTTRANHQGFVPPPPPTRNREVPTGILFQPLWHPPHTNVPHFHLHTHAHTHTHWGHRRAQHGTNLKDVSSLRF